MLSRCASRVIRLPSLGAVGARRSMQSVSSPAVILGEGREYALGLAHDRFFAFHRPLLPEAPLPPSPQPSMLSQLSHKVDAPVSHEAWATTAAQTFLDDLAVRVAEGPGSAPAGSAPMHMTSVVRKRKLKMNKHKYKKLRKRTRALRRKLGK